METSEFGISLIEEFEGFRPTVYLDSGGIKTIGVGHALKQGEAFKALTKEEARTLLIKDIKIAEKSLSASVKNKIKCQAEYDALISFVFNIGSVAFTTSNVCRYITQQKPHYALQWWSRWVRDSKGKVLSGLVTRRKKEIHLFNEKHTYLPKEDIDGFFI